MQDRINKQIAALLTVSIAVSGCMHPVKPAMPTPAATSSSQLPTVLVDQIVVQPGSSPVTSISGPAPVISPERRITVTASNADVRELLPAIAAEGGINLVMSPEVTGRVSVRFVDVPVSVALKAVIEQAGLSIGNEKLVAPWGPVVFYQPPVNVNAASAQLISARFGVSERLAKVVVDSRNAIDKD